jgi:hypothetical protein
MVQGSCPHPWNKNKKGTFIKGHKQINNGKGCFKKGHSCSEKIKNINSNIQKQKKELIL